MAANTLILIPTVDCSGGFAQSKPVLQKSVGSLFEDLCCDGDGGVDWVGDDGHPGLRAVLGHALAQSLHNAYVAGHGHRSRQAASSISPALAFQGVGISQNKLHVCLPCICRASSVGRHCPHTCQTVSSECLQLRACAAGESVGLQASEPLTSTSRSILRMPAAPSWAGQRPYRKAPGRRAAP